MDDLLKGNVGVLLQLIITRHKHNPFNLLLTRSVLNISRTTHSALAPSQIILMARASEFNCHDSRRIRRMKATIRHRLRHHCPPTLVNDSGAHPEDIFRAFANLHLYKTFRNIIYAFNAANIAKNILNQLQGGELKGVDFEMGMMLIMSVIDWKHFRGIPLVDDY